MRMSKQIPCEWPAGPRALRRAISGRLACILLIFASLLAVSIIPTSFVGSAQRAPREPATTTAAARNAALIAATQEVLKETSDLRQLAIIRPVQSATQSRAEIERAVRKNFDEEISPADMHASEIALKKLGLTPPDFQYRAFMIRLLTEQVAGYYEPKTRQFYLADWIDIDGQKPVMAHELTHALQDQNFDLRRFEHWPKGDSDAEMAAHALIEGDATLAMVFYVTSNPLRALSFMKSLGATGIATEELDKAPRALRESLLFPYQEGMIWTRALFKQGGWEMVSRAFKTLPQSTEQIMHPDKYFAHEAPVKVTLPDVTSLLNAGSQESAGRSQRSIPTFSLPGPASWKRLSTDVNGEWSFYLILDQFLKSPADSRRAAAGWAGDRSAVYENAKGEVCYVSVSVWDTEIDAREFFDAYVRRTELRYPGATLIDQTPAQSSTRSKSFSTSEGDVVIHLRGLRTLVLEGIPRKVDINSLIGALGS